MLRSSRLWVGRTARAADVVGLLRLYRHLRARQSPHAVLAFKGPTFKET